MSEPTNKQLTEFLLSDVRMRALPGEDLSRVEMVLATMMDRLEPPAAPRMRYAMGRTIDMDRHGPRKALDFIVRFGPGKTRAYATECNACRCISMVAGAGCFICDYLVNEITEENHGKVPV